MEKKTVLITGASSGIGEGCARKFAMNGYRLILNGRNVEKLTAVNANWKRNIARMSVCCLSTYATAGLRKRLLTRFPKNGKR